jgi:hypothetical protein
MSDTGKQSPLGVNVMSSLLQNNGLGLNPIMIDFAGSSKSYSNFSFGSIVQNTVLRLITWSINDACLRGQVNGDVYNNIIFVGGLTNSIGLTNIVSSPSYFTVYHDTSVISQFPAGTYIQLSTSVEGYNDTWLIGTSKTGSFVVVTSADPGNVTGGNIKYGTLVPGLGNSGTFAFTWNNPTTGPYGVGTAWGGTSYSNGGNKAVTQWGFNRLITLQAWDEFNYNEGQPKYKDFLGSFQQADSFINYTNSAITAADNSKSFLEGTYSNMNDLISADITGVSLATFNFGQDLIKTGRAINLKKINTFGLPSNLLETLQENNAVTPAVSLALLAAGMSQSELAEVLSNKNPITKAQQIKIYKAFTIILGKDLQEVLIPLNCKTEGLESLADLLNPKKLFPTQSTGSGSAVYQTLTVPLYNTGQAAQGATAVSNTKTVYYGGNNLSVPYYTLVTTRNADNTVSTVITATARTTTSTFDSNLYPNFQGYALTVIGELNSQLAVSTSNDEVDLFANTIEALNTQVNELTGAASGNTSFATRTYPISKIYYFIYGQGTANASVNSQLTSPTVSDRVVPVYPAGQPAPNFSVAAPSSPVVTSQSSNVEFVAGPVGSQSVVAGDPTPTPYTGRDPSLISKEERDDFIKWQRDEINPVTGKTIGETWAAQGISNPFDDARIQNQAVQQIQRADRREDLFQSQGVAAPTDLTRPWEQP